MPPPEVDEVAAVVVVMVNVFAVMKSTINSALNSDAGIPPIGPTTPEKVT